MRFSVSVLQTYCKIRVKVALLTGMRKGELLALEWKDVDLINKLIFVRNSKSGKARTIPMNDLLTNMFRFDIKVAETETKNVFCFDDGTPVRYIDTAYRNALKRAGIVNANFHTLRHTWISQSINNGADPYAISKIAGHSSFSTTEKIYTHTNSDFTRRAVAPIGNWLINGGKMEGFSEAKENTSRAVFRK